MCIRDRTWDDDAYPASLRTVYDPPPLLFVKGTITVDDAWSVAVVGTRNPTAYGREVARQLATDLVRNRITVVSGLARGVDAQAHRAALDGGGRTLAVLGCGVDVIYPYEHRRLAQEITEAGALISDYPLGTLPEAGKFPPRNRIISGLSLGVVVVEAGVTSGALITAQFATEQGREVFALPGMVTSPGAGGCNQLIRDGARLIRSPEDVLDELGPLVEGVQLQPEQTVRHAAELQLNEQETCVLQAINVEPTDINQVIAVSGLPVPRVLSTLSVLEMRRLVRRLSGQLVQRL